MTDSQNTGADWPRRVEGHLIERDVRFSPGGGDVTEFRCVECGEVFDDPDPETLRSVPCSVTPAPEDGTDELSPTPDDRR